MAGLNAREYWLANLERSQVVIDRNTEGITHADALLQLPSGGNCMNWILGHIAESRDEMLLMLGKPSIMAPAWIKRYEMDSPPVTDESDAMRLEDILALLSEIKAAVKEAVIAADQAFLDEIVVPARNQSRWNRLEFMIWHEAYHVGQLEYGRNLAGKHEKLI